MSVWTTKRICEISDVVAGGTPRTTIPEYWDGNVSWITPNDLSNHHEKYISNGNRNISKIGLKEICS